MSDIKNILNEIGNREDEILNLCRRLIGFKSVNPPGDVSDIAGFIKDYLLGKGFRVETISAEEDRINVIASLQGGEKRTLVWNGHMDVVPPGKLRIGEVTPTRAPRGVPRLWEEEQQT